MGLPDPTPIQYDMADWIQHGPRGRALEGFRGVAKSYECAAYSVWRGLLDPSENIMVVSSNKDLADKFVKFCLQIIRSGGELTAPLLPRDGEANQHSFSFSSAPPSRSASIFSKGITSSNTGDRASLLILDDVVSLANSMTQTMRDKLRTTVAELTGAIAKPDTDVLYLYTMQTEDDPMHDLPSKGVSVRIFPAEVPDKGLYDWYGDRLCPYVRKLYNQGVPAGTPTDPTRFDADELVYRRLQYGNSSYCLQFLLDHRVSDENKFPLKMKDFMVSPLDNHVAFSKWIYGADPKLEIKDIPLVTRDGDRLYRPMGTSEGFEDYQGTVMFVDPSGKGQDETAWAVVSVINGQMFVREWGGTQGGYEDPVLDKLSKMCAMRKVHKVLIEQNFGGGMFSNLLQPWLVRNGAKCSIEDVNSTGQKELRIIDTLEPLLNQHRIVLDSRLVQEDWESTQDYPEESQRTYMGVYQLTRITKERGCLRHDDRVEALAGACRYWVEHTKIDVDRSIRNRDEKRQLQRIKDFIKKCSPNKIRRDRALDWRKPRCITK